MRIDEDKKEFDHAAERMIELGIRDSRVVTCTVRLVARSIQRTSALCDSLKRHSNLPRTVTTITHRTMPMPATPEISSGSHLVSVKAASTCLLEYCSLGRNSLDLDS